MLVIKFTICANCVAKSQDGTLERPIPDLHLSSETQTDEPTCRICGTGEQHLLMAAEAPERQLLRSSNRRWLREWRSVLSMSAPTKTPKTFGQCPTCGKWGQQ